MGRVLKVLLFLSVLSAVYIAYQWRDTFDPAVLSGRRVLVTGASKGIGEQIAYHYARFGSQIVITARTESALKKVAEKCLQLGSPKVWYIPADMSDPEDPNRVLRFALDKLGGIDYLVLNHIGNTFFQMWNGDVEHIRVLMQANFLSYAQMASSGLPFLKQSNGSIIAVSSILAKIPSPFTIPYTATKSAVNGFFGSLQHELSMQKVNVSITLCTLGLIDTETALSKVKGVIDTMSAYPASGAALEIIKGGATRQKEIFYPWYWQLVCAIRDWFPGYRDSVIQSSYKYNP
ncbi:hydroxysteroid 11-beta-dehydrogenase 1-like protein [Polypterus senegalus]|uniref:hydroxysteroid 11-beta-dehydrogenase 1-like protein n=1 Tax=Polypterus senegalus TaxID=55291 RepID=UPI0019626EAC|nr:hydroxysteroid 11-beta-dehydrogenase 1-like protein [Polypterus senegalus]